MRPRKFARDVARTPIMCCSTEYEYAPHRNLLCVTSLYTNLHAHDSSTLSGSGHTSIQIAEQQIGCLHVIPHGVVETLRLIGIWRNSRAGSSRSNIFLYLCNRYKESSGAELYGRNLTHETPIPSSMQTLASEIRCWFCQRETKTRSLGHQPPPVVSTRHGMPSLSTHSTIDIKMCRKVLIGSNPKPLVQTVSVGSKYPWWYPDCIR